MTKISLLAVVLLASLWACDREGSKAPASKSSTGAEQAKVAVGSVYAIREEGGKFSLCKVIAVDDSAVHIRIFADTFASPPASVDTAKLGVSLGHAPVDRAGFLSDKPVLIQTEPVREAELEGYKTYLDMTR